MIGQCKFDPAKKILALDPARLTGYAHSAGHFGTWDIGTGDARLERLRSFVVDAGRAWGCKLIACEHSDFGSPFPRVKAMHAEQLGIIKHAARALGVQVVTYAPASIKKFATGSGRADKAQVMRACRTFFGIEPRDDNEADAIFVLAMAEQGYQTNTKRKAKPRKPRAAKSTKPPAKKPGMLF